MSRAGRLVACGLLLLIAACATEKSGPEKITLTPAAFSDLKNWSSDHVGEAVPALLRSCPSLQRKDASWVAVCRGLASLPLDNDAAARAFFEQNFRPYAAVGNSGETGLFTGYYEASLHGSPVRSGAFQTPLYARPADLIDVDLGDFKKDLKGQHIAGKVDGRKLKPYDERKDIARGSLAGRGEVLAWVDDPVDAFFLAVQGSGRVRMTDGTETRIGYDGSNGRAYVAIGRAMADMNLIGKPVTMQSIRAWLKDHPDRDAEIMNLNPSYVFFKRITGDGPIGAAGVPLTAERSIAVDPAFVTLGNSVWIDTVDGRGAPLQRLVVAQDTGGAIKGPVRADFFWGVGDTAADQAGRMQSRGRYYLLLPKAMHVPQ